MNWSLLQKPEFRISILLVLATLLVYGQVYVFDFVNYDDPPNVTSNPHVIAGLTWPGVKWAFTSVEVDYWKPLTRLSHMLDCELFGLHAGSHHLTNLIFHLANVLLLFSLCRRLTGDLWPSAFVAALFALHPLHVNSVAWVTERKDVLSTLFWLLSLRAYAGYVERPGRGRYLLVILYFVLGLMSKPMLVTLPFVLLLFDVWPFKRLSVESFPGWAKLKPLLWEKVPLFALAVASSAVTYFGARDTGQLATIEVLSVGERVSNAVVSYARYIGKMIWPGNLSFYYPHPGQWPIGVMLVCALVLLVITVGVVWARRRPWLLVGWLWYLGTLLPVIGLIQGNSAEAMADRFVYVPLMGLYFMVAWGVPDLVARFPRRRLVLSVAAGIVLLECAAISWLQAQTWSNSIVMCRHALEVTTRNHIAHINLAVALADQGRLAEAIEHYTEALRIKPDHVEARYSLGVALQDQGKDKEAIVQYKEAVRLRPGYGEAHSNLGLALASVGQFEEAESHYSVAIRLLRDPSVPLNNSGLALAAAGKTNEAIERFKQAIQRNPRYARVHCNLADAYVTLGDIDKAVTHYREAVRLDPEWATPAKKLEALRVPTVSR